MHHYIPWQERARCREFDPEIFFPEKGGSSREAKRICAECEVRIQCLNYALRRDERYGVWGGMSERERRRLKRMASWAWKGGDHGYSAEEEVVGAEEDRWPEEVDRQKKDDSEAEDDFAEAVRSGAEGSSDAEA
jgi:WhiB family transcriptional regulator, redox-sensing transcriptional regulator